MNTIRKTTEALLEASREVGIFANRGNTVMNFWIPCKAGNFLIS